MIQLMDNEHVCPLCQGSGKGPDKSNIYDVTLALMSLIQASTDPDKARKFWSACSLLTDENK